MAPFLIDRLKNGGDALAAANAHRDQRKYAANSMQFMQRFDSHNCTGGSQRVPERNSASIWICFVRGKSQFALNREYLGCKSFVQFDDIRLFRAQACTFVQL